MQIILTGASSFLGRAAAAELLHRGHSLCLLRHSFEEEEEKLPARADTWIHFAWAGVGSAGRQDETVQAYNIEMSMAALKKAAELGCTRFLFAGSQAEYGRACRKDAPSRAAELQSEDCICAPVSAYGRAKLAFAEKAREWLDAEEERPAQASAAGLKLVHMRVFSVYGPGDHAQSLVSSCLRAFCANEPMAFGACAQDWNYLYIDDAARAAALLTETEDTALFAAAPDGILNVAGSETYPLRQHIEEMHALCHSTSLMQFGARGDNAEGAVSLRPDTERLGALGFTQEVRFAEGIRRMLERGAD